MLLFIINVNHKEMKIIEAPTMAYLTSTQHDNLSETGENNKESVIVNVYAAASEPNVEMLPLIPTTSKMIFPGDHIPLRKVLLQDMKISADRQEKLNSLIHTFENIMSSSSYDTGYTKLIEIDIVICSNWAYQGTGLSAMSKCIQVWALHCTPTNSPVCTA